MLFRSRTRSPSRVPVSGRRACPDSRRGSSRRLRAARLLAALGAGGRSVGVPSDVRPGPRAEVVVGTTAGRRRRHQAPPPRSHRLDTAVDPLDVFRAQRQSEAALYVLPDSSVDDVVRATLDLRPRR